MATDTAAATPAKEKADPKNIWLIGITVVGLLFLGGFALRFFLTEFGGGIKDFAVQVAMGATAGQPAIQLLLMVGLGFAALFGIPLVVILGILSTNKALAPKKKTVAAAPAAAATAPPAAAPAATT